MPMSQSKANDPAAGYGILEPRDICQMDMQTCPSEA